MESYILRIYRHGPNQLIGMLETVPDGIQQGFTGINELAALLNQGSTEQEDESAGVQGYEELIRARRSKDKD
ncbi:MAG: hypothetical protein P8Z75_14000 [Gammaproteobacteria bacterium]|jgi:hypothetical protein